MPYISTKLNFKLEQADELALKDEFGKAISIFPGKSERYLMLHFQDTCDMYFGGDNDDKIAMIEVKMFGMPDKSHCDEATRVFTEILSNRLAIDPMNIYIKYEDSQFWGMGGKNF